MKRCAKSQDTAQVEKPVPANILQKKDHHCPLRVEAVVSLQRSNIPLLCQIHKLHKSCPLLIGEL